MADRHTGTVKWFKKEKGYGFITSNVDNKDIFVHFSAIAGDGFKTLRQDEKVEFELKNGQKGLEASNVIVIK